MSQGSLQTVSSWDTRPRKLARPVAFHTVLAVTATVMLLPALRAARFPFSLDWSPLALSYIGIGFQSVVLAAILVALQHPRVLMRFGQRLVQSKARVVLLGAFALVLTFLTGVVAAALSVIFAIAVDEFIAESRSPGKHPARHIASLLPAISYLFLGLVLAFVYTNIIVRLRFFGSYDEVFNHADRLLFRITVPDLAHRVHAALPAWCFAALNAIYYGMFAQIGAALLICGLRSGARRALQFVGAILVAYFLSLTIFYIWPSHGPYYLCSDHFQHVAWLNGNVGAYTTQRNLLANAQYLWQGLPVRQIPTGYYVAFPCMHIAQPLIVLWFLRRWKVMLGALAIYDVILVSAIVLLEWHYMVDLLGGAAVATLAIVLTDVMAIRESQKAQEGSPSLSREI